MMGPKRCPLSLRKGSRWILVPRGSPAKPQVGRGTLCKARDPSIPQYTAAPRPREPRVGGPREPEAGRGSSGKFREEGAPADLLLQEIQEQFLTLLCHLVAHFQVLAAGARLRCGREVHGCLEPRGRSRHAPQPRVASPPTLQLCARRRRHCSPPRPTGMAGTNRGARARGFRAKPAQ